MKKMLIICVDTFSHQVKSWNFISLSIFPFVIILTMLGFNLINKTSTTNNNSIGIINETSSNFYTTSSSLSIHNYKNQNFAKKELEGKKIIGYLAVSQKNDRLLVTYTGNNSLSTTTRFRISNLINNLQEKINFKTSKLSNDQKKILQYKPIVIWNFEKSRFNKSFSKELSFTILVLFMFLILVSYSTTTTQEIAAEKGTKTAEIIFTSIEPKKYFLGKILGMLGTVCLQIAVYISGGTIIYQLLFSNYYVYKIIGKYQGIINSIIRNFYSINLVFIVLGIVLFIILAATCGILVKKVEDASKAVQPVLHLVMLSFILAIVIGKNPSTPISIFLSYFPVTSPFFMPIRNIVTHISIMNVLLSALLLLITEIVLLHLVGKNYSRFALAKTSNFFELIGKSK
ncbi:abc transporter, permease protein [Liquorilactobacillus ghanensis DSM 18630]|uniref:Abc transporter, permease protein n=1 Tax=Liquorilactobacillus ghanensis DSM 18630 TaxID=1423750 RepID=A0A0R1VGE0_9LACO|nr:ABC transporter permease [Liquorilactobacillus ghanensis]KRM04606.1 abc transporter, permease protein [Liquorilactobacillus ghanensis DSM 18630]